MPETEQTASPDEDRQIAHATAILGQLPAAPPSIDALWPRLAAHARRFGEAQAGRWTGQ